ncbi:MAG: AAA family ATPase [Clostridia bacterium]
MKLIKCYIENFGKLQGYTYSFNGNLNVIKQENGWGKSTLAYFIKAMFYGMPASRVQDLDENDRKKFMPWQSGSYGGNLEFEISGKKYKIERFFGKKEIEDTFKLIDLSTGKESKNYSQSIGEEIFELDCTSYCRSTFVSQKSLDTKPVGTISRLNSIINNADNTQDLEKALVILDKKRSILSKTGERGEIAEKSAEINSISQQINELENNVKAIIYYKNTVVTKNSEIDKIESNLNSIKKQIREYGIIEEQKANKTVLNNLEQECLKIKIELDKAKLILNNQNLDKTELGVLNDNINQLAEFKTKLTVLEDNKKPEQKVNNIIDFFNHNVPDENILNELIQKSQQLTNLKQQNESLKSQISDISTNSIKSKPKKLIFLTELAILFLAVSIIGFFINNIVGYIGIILLFTTCFIEIFEFKKLLKSSSVFNSKNDIVNSLNNTYKLNEENIKNIESKLNDFVSKYGIHNSDYYQMLTEMKSIIIELKTAKIEIANKENHIAELKKDIINTEQQITAYLSNFNTNNKINYQDSYYELKTALENSFKYNQQLLTQEQKITEFKKGKIFNDLPINFDINTLQKQEKNMQNDISILRDECTKTNVLISKLEEELDNINLLESKKEMLIQEKERLSNELNIIKETAKLLVEANEDLSARYLEPMKQSVQKYLKLITKLPIDNLHLNTNLEIKFTEFGQERELDYYSRGYKNIFELCIRLALIDTLFKKEKPWIILDDPFVNLDDEKAVSAMDLIKTVSKEYQIVYFVCHESRIIK